MIKSLRRSEPTAFNLNIEDDVAGFLGILLDGKKEERVDGTIVVNHQFDQT
jgi:hypothetical protein